MPRPWPKSINSIEIKSSQNPPSCFVYSGEAMLQIKKSCGWGFSTWFQRLRLLFHSTRGAAQCYSTVDSSTWRLILFGTISCTWREGYTLTLAIFIPLSPSHTSRSPFPSCWAVCFLFPHWNHRPPFGRPSTVNSLPRSLFVVLANDSTSHARTILHVPPSEVATADDIPTSEAGSNRWQCSFKPLGGEQ